MPTGTVRWMDARTGVGSIRHLGHDYPVRIEDVETAARVPRARVHFDVARDGDVTRATNVTLQRGKRQSQRRHRFGDLAGAARPDEKGRAPLTHTHREIDLEPGPQPMHVVRAWVDAMIEKDLPTALTLYAPDARFSVEDASYVGRRQIEQALAESALYGLRAHDLEIFGDDGTVVVRWGHVSAAEQGGETRLRIEHDRIVEQWM